jgi:hypothetical protein
MDLGWADLGVVVDVISLLRFLADENDVLIANDDEAATAASPMPPSSLSSANSTL